MNTESEYEAEALSMLTQYGQTITMTGNGLAKCPYVYKEQYNVGDWITVAFSGKSAVVQILSITEHWAWGSYDIQFSFGKPQNNLADQLQLMLRKIQSASEKASTTDSVRWYTIPTDTAMPKADVTYNTIGFIGDVGSGATFKLYLDDEKTGAKTYHVWFKQLAGSGKLTLTTGKSGAVNLTMGVGTYVAIISVDENGNIVDVASTPTDIISSGNSQPATSSGVASAISQAVGDGLYKSFQYLNSNDDVNNCTSSTVIYCSSSTAVCASLQHRPLPNIYGECAIICLELGNPNYLMQYFFAKNNHIYKTAYRVYDSVNGWSDWREITDVEDIKVVLNYVEDFQLSWASGYSGTYNLDVENFRSGNLVFIHLALSNVSGGLIGTFATNVIGVTNLRPLQSVRNIGIDYISGRPVRCTLMTDGTLSIDESVGVTQGDNNIRVTIAFPV